MIDYLIVVDFPDGIANPVIQKLDIPKDQLKSSGDNPQFVEVVGIKAISENSVVSMFPRASMAWKCGSKFIT